jgi:hypothetical protein
VRDAGLASARLDDANETANAADAAAPKSFRTLIPDVSSCREPLTGLADNRCLAQPSQCPHRARRWQAEDVFPQVSVILAKLRIGMAALGDRAPRSAAPVL